MKHIFTLFICLFSLALYGQIIPTEIMYNSPESGTDSLEFIELYNSTNDPIQLAGYEFTEGINYVFDSIEIAAKSYIVLCVNDSSFQHVFGFQALAQWTSGALSNGGETLELQDGQGNVVFNFTYDDNAPWPDIADGDGPSLALCELEADITNVNSWGTEQTSTGIIIEGVEILATPGEANDPFCGLVFDHRVEVSSNRFSPDTLMINPGEIVLWENVGGFHNVDGTQVSYPDNPSSFTSGAPSADLWTYTYQFMIPGTYNYQCNPHASLGMQGVVMVIDPAADEEYPMRSIASVTTNDAQGVPDSINVKCSLQGVVHKGDRRADGYEFALLDANGDGINCFSLSPINDVTITEGDELIVKGTIGQFNGLSQIVLDSIEVLSQQNATLMPREVSTLDETTENELITLGAVRYLDVSQWTGTGSGFNLDIEVQQTGETYAIRIDNETELYNLAAPPVGADGSWFTVTGIGGQFDNSAPYDEGYQIFPFTENDFTPISSSPSVQKLEAIIYPNPASDLLHIQGMNEKVHELFIFSLEGRMVDIIPTQSRAVEYDIQNLPKGKYFITTQVNGQLYRSSFVKM